MFSDEKTEITTQTDARKQKIDHENAWKLLQQCSKIIVGRGKKSQIFHPDDTNKSEILKACLGRTGNLRAPALKFNNLFIIGFNEDMYQQYIRVNKKL